MSQGFSTVSVDEHTQQRVLAIGEALRQKGWSVSCAESCTGGGLAFAFTSVSGSSDWFNQSWVTYSNAAKHRLLGVSESTLATYGAVSEQTVCEMAQGIAAHSGANFGVAISGIAGPGGGSADKPVGLVWFGFSRQGETIANKQIFAGDRQAVRAQAVNYAIEILHQWLVDPADAL